jgi:cobalamin biosynthesis protein CobT
MKTGIFQHELANTSAVFGRKHDVKVVFQGDQAATSGEVIILPTLADGEVSEDSQAVMRGYVDHESGHVRHSDMDALKGHKTACLTAGNKLAPALANALEDVWLEKRVRAEYPGSERNLRAVSTAVNEQFLRTYESWTEEQRKQILTDPKQIMAVALTWEGRLKYGGETNRKCLDLLPDNIRRALPKWIAALNSSRNSSDNIAIANMLDKQIRDGSWTDEPPEEETEKPSGGGEGDDPSDDAGEATDGGFEATDGDFSTAGSSDDPEADLEDCTDGTRLPLAREYAESEDDYVCGEGNGEEYDTDRLGGGAKGADGPLVFKTDDFVAPEHPDDFNPYDDFGVENGVNKVLTREGLLGEAYDKYRPASTAHDKWHHRTDESRKWGRYTLGRRLNSSTASDYNNRIAATASTINVMRRKLERALMAREMRDWDFGRQDGRLDNRRLVQAVRGNHNVFKLRTERAEMDTALTVLIDLSGSMGGDKCQLASQCAIAISEALERTSVQYEVLGFSATTGWLNGIQPPARYGSRWEPIDMFIFKAFHERLFEAKGALAAITECAGGNNVDGESLQYAWSRLSQRPEKRKVMIVLSDGSPAAETSFNTSHLGMHLRSVIANLKDAKCELIGIGILDDSVEAFYDKHVVVSSLEDLAGSAMDQIARVLLGDRFVVDNSKLLEADKGMARAV